MVLKFGFVLPPVPVSINSGGTGFHKLQIHFNDQSKFEISSLLIIPFRLTGVMVLENGSWKFQQQQFQFDIDFSFSILASILLFIWLVIDVMILIIFSFKEFRKKKIA